MTDLDFCCPPPLPVTPTFLIPCPLLHASLFARFHGECYGLSPRLLGWIRFLFPHQGCGTGLSMYMVQSAWPNADLLGVDMSTFKLAISLAKLEKKPASVKSKVGRQAGLRSEGEVGI